MWDESQVKKLQERIQQIKDITLINRFVLSVLPILHKYQSRNLSPSDMIRELAQAGMPVSENDIFPSDASATNAQTEKQNASEIHRLKQTLFSFGTSGNVSAGPRSLAYVFESAAKHMPVYLKIIKGHIEQLAKVLKLETHSHRNLENTELAEPVLQVMQLFRELKEVDIQLLDMLAREAQHWPQQQATENLEAFKENALMA